MMKIFRALLLNSLLSLLVLTSVMWPVEFAQAQFYDQMTWGGQATGGANAPVVNIPNIQSMSSIVGVRMCFIPPAANTGAVSLTVGTQAAQPVKKPSPSGLIALTGGEMVSTTCVLWDGTQYVLVIPYIAIASGGGGSDGNMVTGNYGGSCPSSGVGSNGDYAFDVNNGYVYGPKSGGVWPCTAVYKPPTNIIPTYPNVGSVAFTQYTVSCGTACSTPGPPAPGVCPNPPSGAPGTWQVQGVIPTGVYTNFSTSAYVYTCLLQRIS